MARPKSQVGEGLLSPEEKLLIGLPASKYASFDTLDLVDLIDRRIEQSKAICSLASLVDDEAGTLPANAVENAMWAIKDLLDDVRNSSRELHRRARAASDESGEP